MDDSNVWNKSGSKRVIDEIEGDLEMGGCERLDSDGGVCGKKRFRGIGDEGEEVGGCGISNLGSGVPEMGRNEVEGAEKGELGKIGESSYVLEEKKESSLDLNFPVFDEECVEVVNISSDESGDEEKELVVMNDYKGKGKEIELGGGYENNSGLDLDLGLKNIKEVDGDVSGSMGGGRRYTIEEKGKAKVGESWISLGGNLMDFDLTSESESQTELALANLLSNLPDIIQQNTIQFEVLDSRQDVEFDRKRELEAREFELRREQDAREFELRREHRARMAEESKQRELEYRKRANRRFARPLEKDGSIDDEQTFLSTALNKLIERKLKLSEQQLIRWKPSENRDNSNVKRSVPSLLDLSLKVLAENADAIVSLKGVPDFLKRRLSNILCDSRKMNVQVLDLFVRGSPEEIRVKNASWITDSQFKTSFGSFAAKKLRVCTTIDYFSIYEGLTFS